MIQYSKRQKKMCTFHSNLHFVEQIAKSITQLQESPMIQCTNYSPTALFSTLQNRGFHLFLTVSLSNLCITETSTQLFIIFPSEVFKCHTQKKHPPHLCSVLDTTIEKHNINSPFTQFYTEQCKIRHGYP